MIMKRLLTIAFLLAPTLSFAEDVPIKNLVRAESDTMIRADLAAYNMGVGKIIHEREPVSAAKPQPIIHANRQSQF
jgi:hypothetical protein